MGLDDLSDDVETTYSGFDDSLTVALDRESKQELSMLTTVLDAESEDLVRRGIHLLYQMTVDTGKLDFHLRSEYGVTYDEYLSGMTYDEMTGAASITQPDDDRRYQF